MISPFELKCEYGVDPVGIDTHQPRFSWLLGSDERNQMQSAYQVLVASDKDKLRSGTGDRWDSGRVSSTRSTHIAYAGAPLSSNERCWWTVQVWDQAGRPGGYCEPAMFTMGLLEAGDWEGRWIGAADNTISSPLLRREFTLEKPVKRATVHMSGLGYSELYLNGDRVGDHVLDPGNTYYTNDQPFELGARVLYVSHDVTEQLQSGPNAMGVMLGHGWYSAEDDIPPAPSHRATYGDRPKLLLQLIVEFVDGEQVGIVSDSSWKVASGPITYNDFCNGETWDARLERTGWHSPGYDDAAWQAAVPVEAPGGVLVSQMMPPERVVETCQPIGMTNPGSGVYVFDLGQTITGWSKLHVRGPAGTTVTLKHGICVYDDGMLDARSNLRHCPDTEEAYRQGIGRDGGNHHCARQTETYILKGEGDEVWEPHFTLHSFRYIEVTGYPGIPTLDSLEGRVVHTAVETSGHFVCSNELFNRIHSNVNWTLRGSLQSIPQDAADRSERLGWLGDPGFIAEDYLYNFHSAGFWAKWMNDIQDSQKRNGEIPQVSPIHWRNTTDPYRQWPDWSSTYPVYLWHVYRHYDDERLLADHYESLKKMIDFYGTLAEDHVMNHGLGDHMEPQPDGATSFAPVHTPMPLTSTAYYQFSVWVLARAAQILGKPEDAGRYGALAEAIKTAFNHEFLDTTTNQYGTGSQTSNAVPLQLDLVPPDRVEAVVANLVDDIRNNQNGHLTTGIIGTGALENVLPRYGQADVMFEIMSQTTFPSWGEQIARGATTVWESWDGDPERELSLNMKMFCSTEVFFYRTLAGIGPVSPGYKKISIRPTVVGDLTHVQAEVRTPCGPVAVAWNRENNALAMKVTVPVNTTAQISVPKIGLTDVIITEGGDTIWQKEAFNLGVAGITAGQDTGDAITFNVGSGSYQFQLEGV